MNKSYRRAFAFALGFCLLPLPIWFFNAGWTTGEYALAHSVGFVFSSAVIVFLEVAAFRGD